MARAVGNSVLSAGHLEALQDGGVELGSRAAGKELVELDQKLQIRIVRVRRLLDGGPGCNVLWSDPNHQNTNVFKHNI